MTPAPNSIGDIISGKKPCIVNDQMEPFTILYILIFLISLTGNMMALWVFTCSHGAKKSTNVYLINLLASDLLLTLALPFKLAKDMGVASWSLMVFHCQVSAVLIYISMYASIFFLAFISVDRYLQVTSSDRLMHIRHVGFARLMSVIVWLLVLVIMVPNMLLPIRNGPEERFLSCSTLKKDVGIHWHTFSIFLSMAVFINASVVVVLSSSLVLKRLLGSRNNPNDWDSARQATINVAAVTVAYMVGFVPYHAIRTPYTLTQTQVLEQDCQTKKHLFLAKESTLLLALLHVCFDPILYYYFCQSFRQRVQTVFQRRITSTSGPEPLEAAQLEAMTCFESG